MDISEGDRDGSVLPLQAWLWPCVELLNGHLSDLSPLRHPRDVKAVTDPTLTSAGDIPAL